MNNEDIKRLKKICINVRRNCIKTQKSVGSGHLGGSFSAVEIMVYLYFYKMNVDVKCPLKEDRDIFILSKGHASLGLYSVLAEKGFFEIKELETYRKINSRLQGHTQIDSLPGIENSSGSLGQGLSFGIGMSLGYKRRSMNNKIYVMLGDGELEEGQIWEAAMLQGKLNLDNLITIVDYNKLQLDDTCSNIVGNYNLNEKFKAFGFNVININGHDFEEIDKAFNSIKENKANVIIANTIKGKGISFMENQVLWHSQKVNEDEYEKSLNELKLQEVKLNA